MHVLNLFWMQSDHVFPFFGNIDIDFHSSIKILAYWIQVALRNVDQGVASQIFDLLEKGFDILFHPVVFNRVLENGLD
jgi:hypothetical protein